MDWMATLATAIAILRLALICCGMWLLLRSIARPGSTFDFQRKCFAISGFIYLLGLMPQSLLLLLINSDMVSFMLDNGYFCWTQNFACMVAVALHNIIFLNWIVHCIRSQKTDSISRVVSMVKSKCFGYFIAFYVTVLILSRGYFLRRGDGKRFYTDIASRTDDEAISQWTTSPVENPSQVVRLQLLLCETSISENEVWSFLLASYSFLMLPLVLLYFVWRAFAQRTKPSSSLIKDSEEDSEKEGQQLTWWEKEENIQRLLSTSLTIWFYFIQPVIFSIHQQHFVDFGTHLLMTICVFMPWTLSDKEQNGIQCWV